MKPCRRNAKPENEKDDGQDLLREKHLSAVIDVLRFPLISLVVLYHAFNCSVSLPPGAYDWHQPVTDFIYWKLLHDAIAGSAVPLFFALSGYLYFLHMDHGWKSWWRKTRNRFFRLWIPLWTWASLSLLFLGLLFPNSTLSSLNSPFLILKFTLNGGTVDIL